MGCCTGSAFTPAPDAALDPLKRVNYTFGMVLGVDDFRQEHAYLAARDERALRETIGYGVLTGLGVTAPKPAPGEGQQVRVAAGLALMPDGHLVGVPTDQCANLQTWLDAEKARDADTALNETAYVLLRFAEASDSPVPIPGEPCRDESELSADARVVDGFALDFAWAPPNASEDLALRAVVAWIRGIKVRLAAPAGQTLASFQADVDTGLRAAIEAAWGDNLAAPTVPQPAAATPALPAPSSVPALPAPPRQLVIPRAELAAYYAAAFEVWTRLLRSDFMAHHGPVPKAKPTAERALLLAAIAVKPGADGTRAVRMLGRPQLLHLRLLQEWLLRDGSQDAPREAHYLLGKGDPELDHAQDLLADFAARNHAMTRIDIVPDTTDGGSGNKAKLVPAVKWPGGGSGGGPDYYGPGMTQPIPVADGGTGQAAGPQTGQLLVGRAAAGPAVPARFELGRLTGAPVPKPPGTTTNIVVDDSSAAPSIRLDTIQDIGPGASPAFASLTLTGDLSVDGDVLVKDSLTVDGTLTLGAPHNSLLATDDTGVVVAARGWDGDEKALADKPNPPYAYLPGQKAPVRIEDGGTGLQQRPRQLQVLVGVETKAQALRSEGGDYVLASLVAGKNVSLALTQQRPTETGPGGWRLTVDASGGGEATRVVAAGGAASPANLTAVTDGSLVTIDSVQPLHTAAVPTFAALALTRPPSSEAPDAMLGWRKKDGQLVLTAGAAPAADVTRWPMRYVLKPDELVYRAGDMVLAVLVAGVLDLPDPRKDELGDGHILVLSNVAAERLSVRGVTVGTDGTSLAVARGQSVTLVSAAGLPVPGWLVIGRS